MESSHRTPAIAILYVYIGAIQQLRHLRRGREWTKEATVNDIERKSFSQKSDVPHTNSSMHVFP